ncbi:hypothetical protein CRG98_031526 [Punica granatum]|uniref:Uncharacterized protein n=1 Tax=Punica granatum TaxID=22663 RepID=A0A2I0IVQ8_PUNGR|nr:hypothetical protein CRG98_031526 [Punica granatum]
MTWQLIHQGTVGGARLGYGANPPATGPPGVVYGVRRRCLNGWWSVWSPSPVYPLLLSLPVSMFRNIETERESRRGLSNDYVEVLESGRSRALAFRNSLPMDSVPS